MIRVMESERKFETFFEKVKNLYLDFFPNGSCFYEVVEDGGFTSNIFWFFYNNYPSLNEAKQNIGKDPFQVDFVVAHQVQDSLMVYCNRTFVKRTTPLYGDRVKKAYQMKWDKSKMFKEELMTEEQWLNRIKKFFKDLKKTANLNGWE